MAIIRINNLDPNVKGIGLADGGVIRLMPGINEVDAALWEKHTPKDIVVQAWFKEGRLAVEGDPKKPAIAFGELPLAEASAMVVQTYDVSLLNEWRANEKRGGVLAAIEAQLKKIENPRE